MNNSDQIKKRSFCDTEIVRLSRGVLILSTCVALGMIALAYGSSCANRINPHWKRDAKQFGDALRKLQ